MEVANIRSNKSTEVNLDLENDCRTRQDTFKL